MRTVRTIRFRGSANYWEARYRAGGTSGPGSYGELAQFKADFLNALVAREEVSSVVEFGCGDGNQLTLARYPRYLGLDVSSAAIRRCAIHFAADTTKSFILYEPDAFTDRARFIRADMAMSLDVIFHLVEDHVFETYMRELFAAADRLVIIYSSNHDAKPANPHVRHRRFTEWIDTNAPDWRLSEHLANPYIVERTGLPKTVSNFFVYRRGARTNAPTSVSAS